MCSTVLFATHVMDLIEDDPGLHSFLVSLSTYMVSSQTTFFAPEHETRLVLG